MLKSGAIAILIGVITLPSVFAQEKHNGNWWRSLGSNRGGGAALDLKSTYVVGLIDGEAMGIMITDGSPLITDDRSSVDERVNRYARNSVRFTTAAPGQVVEGMDKFFEDFRNRSISAGVAAWIVLNQIAGATDAQVESLTLKARQTAK